ncbi:major facilitator superfamily domain-containing protein [Xylariales sp. PMI_506]|nr:major facilitator superfamily domain-containing protein [Xylariales sp. PMI_506]
MDVKGVAIADELENQKVESTHHNRGDVLLVANDEVRRVPVPTNDPNDPLNAPQWRKITIAANCCWFAIFSLLCISGIGTFLETLIMMYMPQGKTVNEVVGLSTYPTMVMALGSFGLLPLAFVVGRRPIFLFCVVLALIMVIVAGTSNDFNTHFAARIILGLATGATESLLPLILSDISFLDERSFYFGMYWSSQNAINAGLQIALSYMVAASSWRWYYWLFAITLGFGILTAFFFLPETRFQRPLAMVNGYVVHTDDFGHTHFLTTEEAIDRFGEEGAAALSQGNGEGAFTEKTTFLQTLKPWTNVSSPAEGFKIWVQAYVSIAQSLTSPGVWFALLASSITLGIGVAISLVYSTILEESFGWSAASVGLFNVGIIPAAMLAMVYSGWGADKINVWLAARNGGVHKPEHHLIHLILPFLTGSIGIIVFGIVANEPEKYSAWGLVVAWGIFEFAFTAVIITTTTFAAEVIPDSPGAAMVPVIGGKNIISFAASYGLIPMLAKWSYLKSFMILFGTFAGIFALGIPIYILNPKWRARSLKKEL